MNHGNYTVFSLKEEQAGSMDLMLLNQSYSIDFAWAESFSEKLSAVENLSPPQWSLLPSAFMAAADWMETLFTATFFGKT